MFQDTAGPTLLDKHGEDKGLWFSYGRLSIESLKKGTDPESYSNWLIADKYEEAFWGEGLKKWQGIKSVANLETLMANLLRLYSIYIKNR